MKMMFQVCALLIIACVAMGSSCNGHEEPPTVVVVQQQEPKPQPQPQPKDDYTPSEADQARDNVVLPDHILQGSVAEEEYKHQEEIAQDNVRVVQEERIGTETTYLKVILKLFENEHVLKRVRSCIIATAQNNNYKITDERKPNAKGYEMKVWSELGPISVTETLTAALAEYAVDIERRADNLLIIKPR
jgi:hypothetical protein